MPCTPVLTNAFAVTYPANMYGAEGPVLAKEQASKANGLSLGPRLLFIAC